MVEPAANRPEPNSPPTNRYASSQRMLLTALWLELLALTVKLIIGAQSGSLALLAAALYSAIAAIGAVYAVLSTHRLQQCGRIVWGHSRWEAMLALGLAGLLGFGSCNLTALALQRLVAAPVLSHAAAVVAVNGALGVLLLFGFLNLGWAWLEVRSAKRYGILALAVNGQQCFQEALTTVILVLALAAMQQGYHWLDPLLALGLSVMSLLSGWRLLVRQMPLLVRQVAIAPEAIVQVVKQVDGITHCHQIESRGIVGRQVMVDLRVAIHPEFLGLEGQLMQGVEAALRQAYGPVKVNVQIDGDWDSLQNALTFSGQQDATRSVK
jgi:cation diffusion facilitator family transporter